jgi:hypothetical protein
VRLNDGLPVWHVSASLQRPGRFLDLLRPLGTAAVRLLANVGGDREWMLWKPAAHVLHYRVNVTPEEYALIPPGCALMDAGETGPERPRRR